MALDNLEVVDAIAYDRETYSIILLLQDDLVWEVDDMPHIAMLQAKINSYISYLEREGYRLDFPFQEIARAVFDIRFKYEITENCRMFLEFVKEKLSDIGIALEVSIGE